MSADDRYWADRNEAHELTHAEIRVHLGAMTKRARKAQQERDFATWSDTQDRMRAFRTGTGR